MSLLFTVIRNGKLMRLFPIECDGECKFMAFIGDYKFLRLKSLLKVHTF